MIGRRKMHDLRAALFQFIDQEPILIDRNIFPGITENTGDRRKFFVTGVFHGKGTAPPK